MLQKFKRGAKGFTLVELLVVIAIIGLLSTLAIVALGTARQKSRDARRLADIRQIQTALEMYNSETGAYPVTSTILLGDTTHACLGANGFGATGACTSQFMSLPRDPSGGYYTYYGTATYYVIGATLEGTVGDLSGSVSASADSGVLVGGGIPAPPEPCPATVTYDSVVYDTVEIGTQCWLKQNLNIGTTLASAGDMPVLGNGQIEKWCVNCTVYGAYYTWAEANQLGPGCDNNICTVPEKNQGICPSGWHIPTDFEVQTLEMYLGMTSSEATSTGYRGTHQEGSKISSSTLNGTNSSGFTFRMAGYRTYDAHLWNQDNYGQIWTSSQVSNTDAWRRYIQPSSDQINRGPDYKTYGFPVRCLWD